MGQNIFSPLIHTQAESEEENEGGEGGDGKSSKEEEEKKQRMDKKRKLKERFDVEYDEGDATYFDDLKGEMQRQAQV